MHRISITLAIALSTLLLISICSAQQTSTTSVPNLIGYNGTLKDTQTTASIPSTTLGVTFAIYKQQDGGAPVWQETQNVTPDASGQYSVVLGSTTATGLPSDLFSQQEQRWLGVQVQGQAEQARVLLVSVPYAFKAQEAETLGGLPASAFVKAPPSDVSGGIAASGSTSRDAGAAGPANTAKVGGGPDTVINCVGARNGTIPIWTGSAPPNITLCNSGIYEAPPYGTGAIGILNPNPIAALDVTGATNTSLYYEIGGAKVLSGDSNIIRVGDQQTQIFATPILRNNFGTGAVVIIDTGTGQLGFGQSAELDVIKAQQQIQALEQQIAELQQRLSRLERSTGQ